MPIDILKNMDSAKIVDYIKNHEIDAVLCRVHGPLVKLSQLLEEAGIDHTYVGKKTKLTNSEEFRRFHAFLKLIVNPYDNFAFLLAKDIFGVKKYRQLRVAAAEQGKSHFQVYLESDIPESLFELFKDRLSLEETVSILATILNMDPAVFDTKQIVEFISQSGKTDVQQYLDWLATYDLQEELTEKDDGLILCTIHGAKGLEWNTVIIAGVNEGMLPSKQAIKADDVESERRLAYVSWTRARDQLILTIRPETSENEQTNKITITPISRFVKESKIGE